MRSLRALLIAVLCLLSVQAQAAPVEIAAELQVGDALLPRAVQTGTLVYLSDASGEDDRSEPPIEWPEALEVQPGERLEIAVDNPMKPASVELNFWRATRKNGIPKRKIGHSECFTDLFLSCQLSPDTTEAGKPAWAVTFESPVASGQLYIAANFTWPTSQAAWLFHAQLPKS
jgi:hypothetical protein